jgi:hypothetical protein
MILNIWSENDKDYLSTIKIKYIYFIFKFIKKNELFIFEKYLI